MSNNATAPATEESRPAKRKPPAPPPQCPTCGGPIFHLRVPGDPEDAEVQFRCRACAQASPTERRIMDLLRQVLERLAPPDNKVRSMAKG